MALTLTIDLDAIAANWRTLNHAHGAPTGAVLKADAYGTGAHAVASRLYGDGVRDFFTATPLEAASIRAEIPDARLYVLEGFWADHAGLYQTHRLIPALGSTQNIREFIEFSQSCEQRFPALIHIDTGMRRLGLDRHDLAALAADPAPFRDLDILYIMTHLAAAEDPAHPQNADQLQAFKAARAALPPLPASFANSSGIFLGPDFRSDLARPGVGLYGVNPTPYADHNPMRCVLRLTARVLQLREISAGESVGYNGTWVAERPSRVATLACGYADGYMRSLSNRGVGYYKGQLMPLVGRVSMDLLTFDATDIPLLKTGDEIELIGPHIPPDRVAELAGTNGYEIMTSLSRRADRTFGTL